MALIAQLGEHCTGIAEVVGSNPAQSLKIFSGLCSSSVTAALALMTVITQLLLWDKLLSLEKAFHLPISNELKICPKYTSLGLELLLTLFTLIYPAPVVSSS